MSQNCILTSLWDSEYKNKAGVVTPCYSCRFSISTKGGMYEYPYAFQIPKKDSPDLKVMNYYDVDFAFGFWLKTVEETDSFGELHKSKERVPMWKVSGIRPAK